MEIFKCLSIFNTRSHTFTIFFIIKPYFNSLINESMDRFGSYKISRYQFKELTKKKKRKDVKKLFIIT